MARVLTVGGHLGEVVGDLLLPELVGLGGVDLELEAVGHLGLDVGGVDVELLVPAAQLVDGTVLLAQQRVLDGHLVLPDVDVLEEAGAEHLGVLLGDEVRRLVIEALGLLDGDAVLQQERVGPGRDVAVDQDDLGLEALVVDVEPVDHVRRPVVGRLGLEEQLGGAIAAGLVGTALGLHVLGGHVALEHVAEVRGEGEVHVVEVRHVDHVVDQLATVGALDVLGVPHPVGVEAFVEPGQLRGEDVAVGGGALRVRPHQQLVVDDGRLVALGAGPERDAARVGDLLALAVAAPAPVVEGAGDVVALDLALGEVAAHVPAVAVEDVELALGVLPGDELGAEALDGVRLPVAEGLRETEAVPAAREAEGGGSLVEKSGVAHVEHVTVLRLR